MKRDRDGKGAAAVREQEPPPPPPRVPTANGAASAPRFSSLPAQIVTSRSAYVSLTPSAPQLANTFPYQSSAYNGTMHDGGDTAAVTEQEPPPPPPRVSTANGVASVSLFSYLPAQVPRNEAKTSVAPSGSQAGSPFSSQPGASKNPRHDGEDVTALGEQEPPPPPPRVRIASAIASAQHFSSLSSPIENNWGAHRSAVSSRPQAGSPFFSQPITSKTPQHEDEDAGAVREQEPPPPPPRVPTANGFASAQRFSSSAQPARNGGARGSVAPSEPQLGSWFSSQPSASKKPRHGLDPPVGWRAAADAILSRAAGGSNDGRVDAGGVSNTFRVDAGGGSNPGRVFTRKPMGGGVKFVQEPVARSRRKFAVVCSANFNRSMMAHKLLQENHFRVQSFGTGRDVRLPGKDINSPVVFAFGTPYRDIFDTLKGRDEEFFRRNKLLGLVARNAAVKAAPQRFQEIEGPEVAEFDVVLCFDSRVFYSVVEDLQSRDPETFKPVHVVNMNIKDSPEESAAAAGDVLNLCHMLDGVSQLEEEAPGVLDAFTKKTKRTILHQVCHV